MSNLNRVLSFDAFVNQDGQSSSRKTERPSFKQIIKKDTEDNKERPSEIAPKVIESIINNPKPTKAIRRISKKELVEVLNNIFSDRSPQFTIEDITWDFVAAFNKEASLIISKTDILNPDFYNRHSDELNSLVGILHELADRFDLDVYKQDEHFVDNTATTVKDNKNDNSSDDIEEFNFDQSTNVYESAFLVEDSYKVKATFDVPANLLVEFKKKVQEESGTDANTTYSDNELAEQIVEFILQKFLVIDNLPASIAVGEQSNHQDQSEVDANKQQDKDQPASDEGNINVKEETEEEESISGGLFSLGLSEAKIEFLDDENNQ